MTYVQLYESFWLYAYYLERAFERTADLTVHFNSSFIRELMQMNNTGKKFDYHNMPVAYMVKSQAILSLGEVKTSIKPSKKILNGKLKIFKKKIAPLRNMFAPSPQITVKNIL